MFMFTSMVGKVEKSINKTNGLYVFKLGGQSYQLMGSLLLVEDSDPKFAQPYIHDTSEVVEQRVKHFESKRESND